VGKERRRGLLGSSSGAHGTSAFGGRPRWVAAALSREDDDEASGPVNGPKEHVGSERCWADFGIENEN
jgi:hypothetical protein